MEKKWLLCLLLTMIMGSVSATNRLDSLLCLLDKIIAESHIHTLKRQAHIRQLKSKENATDIISKKINEYINNGIETGNKGLERQYYTFNNDDNKNNSRVEI